MAILAGVLTILTGLVCLVWFTRHLMIWREGRRGFSLTESSPGPGDNPPMISVLVAAKDEAANIETCVRTMLDQDYPTFEVIVCNDRSTDATPQIVERLALQNSRLRLVNITDLPEGWCGKNNAMQTGIRQSKGRWLCMTDADCRQTSHRTLSVAMRYALDTGADMLSVLPVLEMKGFWENAIQPVCGGVLMIWFHPEKVNDPRRSNAYANGAFILMKRTTYEAIGTHEAVKDRVNEDIHLAALVKKHGLNLKVVRSSGLYLVRMYTSLRQIIRGWGRIFFGTFGTMRRLTVSLGVMSVMGVLPYVGAAAGLSLAAGGAEGWEWWRAWGIAGLAAAGIQLWAIFRFYRLIGARAGLFWSYPLACVMVMVSLLVAVSKLRRGATVTWRGTSYARPTKTG